MYGIRRIIIGRCLPMAIFLSVLSIQATAGPVNGTWFLSVDNDSLAQADDHYTNGVQVGWVSGYLETFDEGPVADFMAFGLKKLPLINEDGRQRFISHSLSHRIFTPSDTETTQPIDNDMPYSGLLFGALTAGAQDANSMDAYTLYYGIVGPSAQGEEVQNEFHKLVNSEQVNGWDNQVKDEVLLNVAYEHRRRLSSFGSTRGWGGDIIGQVGGSAGNLISMATVGVGARYGWGVPDDYSIPPQFFGEETIGSRPYTEYGTRSGVWLFTLLNSSYIANAIFWDGNTFKNSPSIDYDPEIARFYVGVKARSGSLSGSFSIVRTSVPWETPDDRSWQTYGRLGVSYSY